MQNAKFQGSFASKHFKTSCYFYKGKSLQGNLPPKADTFGPPPYAFGTGMMRIAPSLLLAKLIPNSAFRIPNSNCHFQLSIL